jgi:hypothetical protein
MRKFFIGATALAFVSLALPAVAGKAALMAHWNDLAARCRANASSAVCDEAGTIADALEILGCKIHAPGAPTYHIYWTCPKKAAKETTTDRTMRLCEGPAYHDRPPTGHVLRWCCQQYVGVRGAYSLRPQCEAIHYPGIL